MEFKIFFSRTIEEALSKDFTNELPSQKRQIMMFFSSSMLLFNHTFVHMCLINGIVSKVNDVCHEPLV